MAKTASPVRLIATANKTVGPRAASAAATATAKTHCYAATPSAPNPAGRVLMCRPRAPAAVMASARAPKTASIAKLTVQPRFVATGHATLARMPATAMRIVVCRRPARTSVLTASTMIATPSSIVMTSIAMAIRPALAGAYLPMTHADRMRNAAPVSAGQEGKKPTPVPRSLCE